MKHQLCSLGLFALVAISVAASAPPPEKLLAADTLAVVTIPEYAKTRAAWKQWPFSQLWADPSMKGFKDKFMDKLKSDVVEPLEKQFGIKFSDYSGLAQGQVTLAVTLNGWDGKSDNTPGFLFLIDSRDKSDVLKTNLANLKKKWVDGGKQLRVEKIRDVEFTTLLFKSDDLSKTLDKVFPDPNAGNEALDEPKTKKPAKQLEWIIGQSDSLLIMGSSPKDIEKILVNQSGGAVTTLSEQSSFSSSYASLFRDSQAYGWVDLKTVVDNLAKAMSKDAAPAQQGRQQTGPRADKIFSAVGLTGLQTLAFNLRDASDGCLIGFNLNVPESSRRGLFRILSFEQKDAGAPLFVPADAVKFSRWRLDLQKAWTTLENTLTEAIPQMAGVLKLVLDNAGKDKDPDFDLRKNLIANLGDDVISYEKTPRKQTLTDLKSPPSLLLISSPRPEQLAASVKALSALMPQQSPKYKEREFLGRKVYAMSLPATMGAGGSKPVERTLHYTASGGYVGLSTDVAMLEEYLRSSEGSAKTLRDTPGLANAAQKVGGTGTGVFGFENNAETTKAMLDIMKKESGTLANLFSSSPFAGRLGMGEDSNKFKDWVDFSLLPPFEKISKYFYLSVWSGSVTPEGITFKAYAPNPPQLKK